MLRGFRKLCLTGLAFLMIAGIFSSCKNSGTMTPAEIADHIKRNVAFVELTEFDKDLISTSFLNIDSSLIGDSAVFVSSQEDKADELIVIKLADSEDFDKVFMEINAHISLRTANFSKQSEQESKKIQNPVIRQLDGCIILVVCDQNQHQKAAEVLRQLGAQEVQMSKSSK